MIVMIDKSTLPSKVVLGFFFFCRFLVEDAIDFEESCNKNALLILLNYS